MTTETNASATPFLLPGISQEIQEANARIMQYALEADPVFITGEIGTEKAFAGRLIHTLSPRSNKPLSKITVTWNLPSDLGATYTGSDGGSLIINLTREFPVDMQYMLVEMATDGIFTDPVSGNVVEGDVRLILITSLSLEELSANNPLLPELSELLLKHHIEIPPVRDRPEDIPALVRYAIARAQTTGRCRARAADAQVLSLFRQWKWPGNAEDLLLVTAQAAMTAAGELIAISDLPEEFLEILPKDMVDHARTVRLPDAQGSAAPQPAPKNADDTQPTMASIAPPKAQEVISARSSQSRQVRKLNLVPPAPPQKPPVEPPRTGTTPIPVRKANENPEFPADAHPAAPPLLPEHRLLSLARRLNAQSELLSTQIQGPLTPGIEPNTRLDADTELTPELEVGARLESELERELDLVMKLRRHMAVLNANKRESAEAIRDIFRRLLLAGYDPQNLKPDPEFIAETEALAKNLERIDQLLEKVTTRMPDVGQSLKSGIAELAQGILSPSSMQTPRPGARLSDYDTHPGF